MLRLVRSQGITLETSFLRYSRVGGDVGVVKWRRGCNLKRKAAGKLRWPDTQSIGGERRSRRLILIDGLLLSTSTRPPRTRTLVAPATHHPAPPFCLLSLDPDYRVSCAKRHFLLTAVSLVPRLQPPSSVRARRTITLIVATLHGSSEAQSFRVSPSFTATEVEMSIWRGRSLPLLTWRT